MRRIIVHIAATADGFIARKDGSFDFLDRPSPKGNYGMNKFFKSVDTILWGRKTYDQALERPGGVELFSPFKNWVLTHRIPDHAPKSVQFIREPIKQFAQRLRSEPGKDIWVMGGGGIIKALLDVSEIDDFYINVIPVFIGEGISLIEPSRRTTELKLLDARRFSDGVLQLRYGCR
jgi:dihydrofolate reductase